MGENKYISLLERYDDALSGIHDAENEYGKQGVKLLVAAKYATSDELDALVQYRGLCAIGENRTDTLLEHHAQMKNKTEIHFIGHLQRNKVKSIIDKVALIHSLGSEGLAEEIEKQASRLGITVNVLAEVNIGREESKSGVMPEELNDFCLALGKYPHIRLCGFMTMAPICESFAEYHNYFKETYDLSLDIWRNTLHNIEDPVFSMGMSASYRAAIAAGATVVRLGSSVFGRTTADMLKLKNENKQV